MFSLLLHRKTLEKVSDEAKVRQTEFIKRHRGAVSYKFDTKNSEWYVPSMALG